MNTWSHMLSSDHIIKRFWSPVTWKTAKKRRSWFFAMSNRFILDLVAVAFTTRVWDLIQQWDTSTLHYWILAYCGIFVCSYGIKFYTRFHWPVRFRYEVARTLWERIYKKFFLLDIAQAEKFWTWRLTNVIEKWVENRVDAHFTVHYAITKTV